MLVAFAFASKASRRQLPLADGSDRRAGPVHAHFTEGRDAPDLKGAAARHDALG